MPELGVPTQLSSKEFERCLARDPDAGSATCIRTSMWCFWRLAIQVWRARCQLSGESDKLEESTYFAYSQLYAQTAQSMQNIRAHE